MPGADNGLPVTDLTNAYTRLALAGDRPQAQDLIFNALNDGLSVRDIYLHVFQPSLYEIGRQWETGQISIAQEHLATALTQAVLSAVYAQVDLRPDLERDAIVACLAGNHHEIGPRMLADFLQMAGYNTRFLGANTPEDCLIEMIDTVKPDVVGLPATTSDQVTSVKTTIERLRADFTTYRPTIMVGGLAFNLVDGMWKSVKADLWGRDAGEAIDDLVGSAGWS